MSSHLRLALGGACAILAGAVLGLASPHGFVGAVGWSIAICGMLFGLGGLARRALRVSLGYGEQMVLGAAVWIAATGLLLSVGVASYRPLLVLAFAALALGVFEIVSRGREPSTGAPGASERRGWILLAVVLGVYLLVNLLGLVRSRGNPFDDHVGYTAFVKRLLDTGDMIEPFSFRRLSAYGGQTALLALAGLRGDIETTDLLDRGIFQAIAVLVLLDLARRRRLHVGATALIAAFLLCQQEMSINSAPQWSGLAMFLCAYNFASRDDLAPRTSMLLVFIVCGTACTMRQNYIPPAGLFSLMLVIFHLRDRARTASWRIAWTEQRRAILICIAAVAVVVLPYAVAAWRSNHTFLYPVVLGTANPAAPLQPTGFTWLDELVFFANVVMLQEPIQCWWLLLPFMLLARDTRPGRPWLALLVSSALGFVFLVHSFTLADSFSLWRYGSAYLTALALAFLVEAAGKLPFVDPEDKPAPPLRVPIAATWFVWLAVMLQIVHGRWYPIDRFKIGMRDLQFARSVRAPKSADVAPAYHAMQQALPPGARVAGLLDHPYLLDYARIDFVSLDMPGFAAPAPGLPSFLPVNHWRSYFLSQGIRYLAFTTPDRSNYLFRRQWWLGRMYEDGEIWRYIATHMVDTMDALVGLAREGTVLFDRDGLRVVDLGTSAPPEPPRGAPELERQDRFLRQIAERELGHDLWRLAARSNVVFDNVAPIDFELPDHAPDAFTGALGALIGGKVRPTPGRWLMDRTRLRLRGEHHQRLSLELFIDAGRLRTTPTVTVTLDGETLANVLPGPDGNVRIDATTTCQGWCDLYIHVSSISEYWRSADDLRGIKLLGFDWVEER
ncbi:MAG: hypothetical protein ACTHU0_25885 [Kofleriaceae bacterium]